MRSILLLLCGLALAACETLPAAGPNERDIRQEVQRAEEQNVSPGFTIVEMDEAATKALEGRPVPDFSNVFTDHGAGASFRIEKGDVVNVTIWESLSSGLSSGLFARGTGGSGSNSVRIPPQVVGHTGQITVPFAGRVPVLDRTPVQVEGDIVQRLEGKAINPQAIVSIEKAASNKVTVVGDGVVSGAVDIAPGADRITDVIAMAGGLAGDINRSRVSLARDGVTSTMPLERIFREPAQNLRLSPGDVVTVEQRPNFFVAVGATGLNARLPFGHRAFFLSDALGTAGGVLDSRADPEAVYVLRMEDPSFAEGAFGAEPIGGGGATPIAYHFDMKLAAGYFLSRRFPMRDKDIIYVSNAPSVELQKLLDIFRTTATSALVLDQAGAFN